MTASTVTVDANATNSVPINVEVITEPVAQTSRKLYEKATTGAQWYIEQWEDLFIEAKHMALGSGSHVTAAEVLADLSNAKVASDSPGRLRLRLKSLRWQDELLAQSAQALGSIPGINLVETSTAAGSFLIFYDKARFASAEELISSLVAA